MKFVVFTLVKDGMPFLPGILHTLNRTTLDWHWLVAEGSAANTGTTRWCKPQAPGLSLDGTTQFLDQLKSHPRVTVMQRTWWEGGKDQMCQALLDTIKEPCLLMQNDSDEVWESWQLERMRFMFEQFPRTTVAQFDCVYYLGTNIRTIGRDCYGLNRSEWRRAFRFTPGQTMTHEPPKLHGMDELVLGNDQTRAYGLVFHHYAYYLPSQLAYKERFYGYKDALAHWRRLQANTVWPVKLNKFFHWADDRAQADLLHH